MFVLLPEMDGKKCFKMGMDQRVILITRQHHMECWAVIDSTLLNRTHYHTFFIYIKLLLYCFLAQSTVSLFNKYISLARNAC